MSSGSGFGSGSGSDAIEKRVSSQVPDEIVSITVRRNDIDYTIRVGETYRTMNETIHIVKFEHGRDIDDIDVIGKDRFDRGFRVPLSWLKLSPLEALAQA